MFEHRAFGEAAKAVRTGPVLQIAPFNTTSGFMHLIALSDCVLANVTLKNSYGAASDTAINLATGSQLAGVASFDLTSGQIQIISL